MAGSARLTWGSTSLMPSPAQETDFLLDNRPYLIEVSADGTDWGNPEAVITAIRSHLQDGSLAAVTSYDNRTGSVQIRVTSRTYDGLAAAEKALTAETRAPGLSTLTWTPNVALAYPTVFDVVYATLPWKFDDRGESKDFAGMLHRYYTATLELLPFGRDEAKTTVQATSAAGGGATAPTVTSIDSGSSTTGWSGHLQPNYGGPGAAATMGTTNGVLSATIAYLDDGFGGRRQATMSMTRSTAGTTGTNTFVAVDWQCGNGPQSVTLSLSDGAPLDPVLTTPGVAAGFTRSYFKVPAGAFTSLKFRAVEITTDFDGSASLSIDQISSQDKLPNLGTNRQQSRSLKVGGSARARASLVITADAGKTLGDLTMLYTRSATTGLQPPLRPLRVASSSVAAEDNTISGSVNALGSAMVFNIPASRLREAAHDLVARLRATTAGTYAVTWAAALASAANADIAETTQSITGTTSLTFAAANTWQTAELGLLQLPTVPVAADSTHMLRLTLVASSSAVQVDEAWLFDLDNGSLSWATTTGLTRLEARTADLTNPEPSYWGGTADGGAATALVRADWRTVPSAVNGGSFAQHTFEPGVMDVFTVTSGTEGSACSATYCRAWLHNAGAPEAA